MYNKSILHTFKELTLEMKVAIKDGLQKHGLLSDVYWKNGLV